MEEPKRSSVKNILIIFLAVFLLDRKRIMIVIIITNLKWQLYSQKPIVIGMG